MDHEIRGTGLDGRLAQLVVARLVERIDPLAAFLYIPVDHISEIQDYQYEVLDQFDAGQVNLEPVEPENLHVTLLYIDKVRDEDLEEFFNDVNDVMPVVFPVEVSHSGTFPEAEDKPVVLHISPSPSLMRLQSELYNAAFSLGLPLSIFSRPENFKPHISVAYNLDPPDMPIPDLPAPIRISIDHFVASRPEYERLRTVYLPTVDLESVLVEQADDPPAGGPPPAAVPTQIGGSIPYGATTDAQDRRDLEDAIERPVGPDKPLTIRILYDPTLEKEAQSLNTFDTFDITLGPSYYEADEEERAGILARSLGQELARRLLLGPGGAHEWQRADAMMAAPPEDVGVGYRYVFANNALQEAVADVYAVLTINPAEIGQRGYWNASDWIGMAVTEQPQFEPAQLPDIRDLVSRIGEETPFPGVTLILDEAEEERQTLEEMQGDDEEEAMVTGTVEGDEEFGVSKSDLLLLLRGGSLTYGPLRRTIMLDDGPFVMMDDGQPVERIMPPGPIEFEPPAEPESEPEPISIPEAGTRERIREVLRGFVTGALRLIGRHEGPGEHPGTGTEQQVHAGNGADGSEPTDTSEGTALKTPADDRVPEVPDPDDEDQIFHGTGIKAAKSILESGLKVSFADEDNWRSGVIYTAEDRRRAHDFAARSTDEQYAVITIDRSLAGSKPVDARIGLMFSQDIPAEAIMKVEVYKRGYQRKDDELIETITRAEEEEASVLYAAVRITEDGGYRIMGEGDPNAVKRGGKGSGHFGHEGREGEVGGSKPSGEAGESVSEKLRYRRRHSPGRIGGNEQTRHNDILTMQDDEIRDRINFQIERAKELGIVLAYDREEVLDIQWQLLEDSISEESKRQAEELGLERPTREEFDENWTKIIENAGGDPNPKFVLYALREVNDAVEQGWYEPTIPILISRQNLNRDDSAQAKYNAGDNRRKGAGAFISLFQDHLTESDVPDKHNLGSALNRTLARGTRQLSLDSEIEWSAAFYPNVLGASMIHEEGHHWDSITYGSDRSNSNSPRGRAYLLLQEEGGREQVERLISGYASEKDNEMVAEAYALNQHPNFEDMPDARKALVTYILEGGEKP